MQHKNLCQRVKDTCNFVINNSYGFVKINQTQISKLNEIKYIPYGELTHHQIQSSDQDVINFIFALTGMNFCFWPKSDMEYDFLANSVKQGVINKLLGVQNLRVMTPQFLSQKIFKCKDVPLVDQRARILRQIGNGVANEFQGKFVNIVKRANKSVVSLMNILTANFQNFQDHSIYKGHQIFLYKRAQILISDIYNHFNGKGIGQFYDIAQLTMFADYRVPQILRQWGILQYSESLQKKIENKQQINSGSPQEVQIRAYTVIATEMIKDHFRINHGKNYLSIEIDAFLWQTGQSKLKQLRPHHRTLGIYY